MLVVYIIAGIVIGALSAYIVVQWRFSARERDYNSRIAAADARLTGAEQNLADKNGVVEKLELKITDLEKKISDGVRELATEHASKESLRERLENQKKEIEELGKKFNTEFENIANRILDTKSEKFTELNKKNLDSILEPLGKNIEDFKKTVKDTYVTEAKERFSLGEKVKELAMLNQQISEEAKNLTRALKGQSKTQGGWGEMILETILEKSGLRRDEEYFMQQQLVDDEGKPLRTDAEGKKMIPDAVVKYPDNRSVIIDSKVSLNAFSRYMDETDPDQQKKFLKEHVGAVKDRITELSLKGYDDYDKALDFVMMFIPSEPAYIAALQGDPELWNYAYERRILLLSPTNLITSLKLIVDLWKRESQNRNAQLIADRGAKMYDKFVGFVENLREIEKHLDKAKSAYNDSFKQLSTGNDNLVLQATKLKNLGLKNKKELPDSLENDASTNELTE
ncbi:MAG: DNA recombination protein RmuC [Bacteroidales bacterium]